jgi:hypothetical protein
MNYRFEFTADWRAEPMAFWVHAAADESTWAHATSYSPAAPTAIAHRGYAVLCIEADATTLRFSSPEQLDHFIDILGRKPMPSTRRLSQLRGADFGPNSHWLSRLPAALKQPKTRQQLISKLKKIRAEIVAAKRWTSGF